MRLAEKIDEAFETVFLFQRTERSGGFGQQLDALVIARRMTLCASPRMEQSFPMLRRHRIGWLQGKVALLQRGQKVGDGRGNLLFFLVR